MPDPLVSVVIGTFNRETYVRQAVDSVLEQTFRDFEVIVVDDASTDRTPEILKNYGDRIRLIRRDYNSGLPSMPRNQAVGLARGRYVAFLDSDDFWYPSKLKMQVGFMDTHPDIALSHTFCHVVDEASRPLYVRREKEMPAEGDLFGRLVKECFITTSTVMIRKEVFARIGGFDESPQLRRGEDHVFFLRAVREGKIGFVPEVLAAHRKFPDNISGEGFEFQRSILRTQQWILDHDVLWRDRVAREVPLKAYIETCIDFSFYWQARGDYRRSLYFAAKAWEKAPGNMATGAHLLKMCSKTLLKSIRWNRINNS